MMLDSKRHILIKSTKIKYSIYSGIETCCQYKRENMNDNNQFQHLKLPD